MKSRTDSTCRDCAKARRKLSDEMVSSWANMMEQPPVCFPVYQPGPQYTEVFECELCHTRFAWPIL